MKTSNLDTHRSFFSYLGISVKGFCMGAADVIPGVSGGTMAFILGIYEELIKSIRSFDLKFFKLIVSRRPGEALDHISWQFLISVGSGILIAIFSLARTISWLLINQPILIWSFFFGLILGSLFLVGRHIDKWTWLIAAWIIFGSIGTFFLVGVSPASTPSTPLFLFICGAIAICAMILPGISGSFILVLMGKYQYVIKAVNDRDLFTIILVGAGAGLGLIIFSRFLNWFLKKYHDLTIAILTGIMLGSLRKVWPWKTSTGSVSNSHGEMITTAQANILPAQWTDDVAVALCLMFAGLLVVMLLNFMNAKKMA